ncbi:unnamed protein product [Clonostachys rosea]|uniref:Uncharacterized protein n=1 Tax=Bionectria ochroleuca TaxID=29856 RepID=A0ABY6UM60_BIOOC|nr:unnamed protein product [Clonostachys rosea]
MSKSSAASWSREANGSVKEYQPPKSGILARLPSSWVPFAELARIDRPTGIYLFYVPHLFGTIYASRISGQSVEPIDLVIKNVILLVCNVFFRAAACAFNDNMDQEYDRQVERCRLRPVARRAVTTRQAHVFTIFLLLASFGCSLGMPQGYWAVAVPNTLLSVLYPFAKRFTDLPQVILGFQLGLGFYLGVAAIDDSLLRGLASLDTTTGRQNILAMGAFYLANVCWTIVYDTVYAQQDVKDDLKAGVRSLAVWFDGSVRPMLWTVAIMEVALLITSGHLQGFGSGYMALTCGGTMGFLFYMLSTIDLNNAAECSWWFRIGTLLMGIYVRFMIVA